MQRLQEVIELLGHDYHEVRRYLDETSEERGIMRRQAVGGRGALVSFLNRLTPRPAT